MPQKKYQFLVSKIWCTACSGRIYNGLKNVEGILSVKVSVLTEIVFVGFDSSIIGLEKLKDLIVGLDFKILQETEIL